jgi:hypothetical protein
MKPVSGTGSIAVTLKHRVKINCMQSKLFSLKLLGSLFRRMKRGIGDLTKQVGQLFEVTSVV